MKSLSRLRKRKETIEINKPNDATSMSSRMIAVSGTSSTNSGLKLIGGVSVTGNQIWKYEGGMLIVQQCNQKSILV